MPKLSDAEKSRRYRERHRTKVNERRRAAYASTEEWPRKRSAYFKRKYGITEEERDAMLAAQGGVCAICKTDTPPVKVGWVIDHCHRDGHVRGVLCPPCNKMLGFARDNPTTLANAIQYLN